MGSNNPGSFPHAEPHVVIIGGGFAGLNAAKALKDAPVRITLIDRRNHHLFQPLLYQVATASLSPAEIASPIRSVLRGQENVTVLLAEAKAIDIEKREIQLDYRTMSYDYLVIAAGARHSYFGHDEWETNAPGLKSLEDALDIRRRILIAFEEAERATDEATRNRLLTFVVVGGGPTGVELAGALGEISRYSLAKDFDHIDPRTAKIYLLEAAPRILPMFSEKLANKAMKFLGNLGVTVRVNAMVTDVEPHSVVLGDERIECNTVLWAAGVTASPLAKSLGVPLDRAGRVIIEPNLTVKDHPELYVIGDLASLNGKDGRSLPGVAPVAMQEGKHTAANIKRAIANKPLTPFHYFNRGNMATIGRNHAIAEIGKLKLSGFFAWLAWLFVHIIYLIGFRNRVVVALHWLWSYFTFHRSARLITGAPPTEEAMSHT
jgi:NADH:ubiquinone reductase (H+-translocating)